MSNDSETFVAGTDYAKFETAGFADRYLNTFYSHIVQDEIQLAEFLAQEYRKIEDMPEMLEIGCGPCVARALQAAPYVSNITMSDYLLDNLEAIRAWQQKRPDAHDWKEFARLALQVEGASSSDESVAAREDTLRDKIHSVKQLDLLAAPQPDEHGYGLVGAFFCLDSASDTMATWEKVMARASNLISPGGRLFASFLYDTGHYVISDDGNSDEELRQVRLTDVDVRRVLDEVGFDRSDTLVEVARNTDMKEHGYEAIIMVSARRLET
ncbi:guanitoxin biosynthesis pre-guanitoxin forming N-methyltransferase GntF [Amycolatopsis sp. EV170708-02-1]|uniref:guanitoxin biosynthesis pre-guanitoxin forming N-methyltransferase GntF n=1 Tax=Amycolatopsis sp. EV170708-02-1 TaxID=2919322 RepID=UPI001F0C77B9|nr:guanitoxin biosynthesis pre-guanitoxin forming N-methyltransferase GntF [Amycolatopsis sp. EV170708-02-1]UMP06875.1 NNMT/PNMT/TEMT family class I SAM-dependent methyltransferase [Amycolatopsis sp. EV170708-02-1]